MNIQLAAIREQQRQSWNKFSAGWKKWDKLTMEFMRPVGDEIIETINPVDKNLILDIASGTGEPALTIASMLKEGKVFITDIANDMLVIAKENAVKRSIQNIESIVCDVCEMPFENNIFDGVSCRFGFMFFADMQSATNEIYRVLKSGAKVATAVWDIPEKNFWVTSVMGTINKNIEIPQTASGAPGMFRCCKPGLMKTLFENAGFKNIREKEVYLKLNTGTLEIFWAMMTDIGAPIAAALSEADEVLREKIKKEVFALVQQKYTEGSIAIDACAVVISAEK